MPSEHATHRWLYEENERLRTALSEIMENGEEWGGQCCARHAWLGLRPDANEQTTDAMNGSKSCGCGLTSEGRCPVCLGVPS